MLEKIKKSVEFKLDMLRHCRKTLLKSNVDGTIKEDQKKQIIKLEKELRKLKVKESIIQKV